MVIAIVKNEASSENVGRSVGRWMMKKCGAAIYIR